MLKAHLRLPPRSLLADSPDIVVSTPARLLPHLSTLEGSLLSSVSHVVIDEADLLLSYGYNEDLQTISKSLPSNVQTYLMSATLTEDVETLKGLFLKSPVILKLEDDDKTSSSHIKQYCVK